MSQRKTNESHPAKCSYTLKNKNFPPFRRAFLYFPSGGEVTVKCSRMLNKGT